MVGYYLLSGIIGIVIGWAIDGTTGAIIGMFLGFIFALFFCYMPFITGIAYTVVNGIFGSHIGSIVGFNAGNMDDAPFIGMIIGGILGIIISIILYSIADNDGDYTGCVIISTVVFSVLGAVVGEANDAFPKAIYGAVVGMYLGFVIGAIIRIGVANIFGPSDTLSSGSSYPGVRGCSNSSIGCNRCGRCD